MKIGKEPTGAARLQRPETDVTTSPSPTEKAEQGKAGPPDLDQKHRIEARLGTKTADGAPSQQVTADRGPLDARLGSLDAAAKKVAALLPQFLCDLGEVKSLDELGVKPLAASAGEHSLYNRLFGRDSLRMSLDLLDTYPAVAKSTIFELGRLQGVKTDNKSEEEPGKILHEMRNEEEAKELPDWGFPYYGTIDATPLWLTAIGRYVDAHGPGVLDDKVTQTEEDQVRFGGDRTLSEGVEDAAGWLLGRLDDPRAGGFLWCQPMNPKGIENQILEDSIDSVYYEDGTRADPELPYAPIAEQGYAYRALLSAADLLEKAGHDEEGPRSPASLRARAEELKQDTLRAFWQDDLSTFAMAVGFDAEGQGTPMRTVASNAGQLLGSGMLDGGTFTDADGEEVSVDEVRRRLIDRLFEPDLLAATGIRTKSTTAARFREGGYHNGTVWPTISLEIAEGIRRYADQAAAAGDDAEATTLKARYRDLEDRAIRGCAQFPFFPEYFRGTTDGSIAINEKWVRGVDRDGRMNNLEQPPQPQGWTATALERILRRRGIRTDEQAPVKAKQTEPEAAG